MNVADQGDGTYLLSFISDNSGNMSLNVTIQGKHVKVLLHFVHILAYFNLVFVEFAVLKATFGE